MGERTASIDVTSMTRKSLPAFRKTFGYATYVKGDGPSGGDRGACKTEVGDDGARPMPKRSAGSPEATTGPPCSLVQFSAIFGGSSTASTSDAAAPTAAIIVGVGPPLEGKAQSGRF
jgi:hypothetical protein